MKYKYTCPHCGNDGVVFDAWVIWNPDKRDYEIENVFDNCYCNGCENSFDNPEIVEINEPCPECGNYEIDYYDDLMCTNEYHNSDKEWVKVMEEK
jgi:predicted RNA-binding Zn-ribbon protein involved in translation (DUF1610 family)